VGTVLRFRPSDRLLASRRTTERVMQSTTIPSFAVPRPRAGDAEANGARSSRDVARQALAGAQRNPVMSADELFALAQVNALLAIEERLAEIVAELGRTR
jgi:hypothetical protein